MSEFTCTFMKTLHTHNEAYGDILFYAEPYHCDINHIVTCCGNIQQYPQGMPLLIEYYQEGDIFYVQSCKEYAVDNNQTIVFLNSLFFHKTNAPDAKRIVDKLGKDIFSITQKTDAVEQIMSCDIKEAKATEIVEKIREIIKKRRFIEYTSQFGISCKQAQAFYEQYTAEMIHKNPYLFRFQNVPFLICDKLAHMEKPNQDKRTEAVIYDILQRSENNGNTYITFHDLCRQVKKATRKYETIEPIQIASMITEKSSYIYEYINNEHAIYRESTYKDEIKTAENIKRIIEHAQYIDVQPEDIQNVETKLNIKYAPEQKEAFQLLGGVSVLTGGPGTGKTTTLNGMLMCYENKKKNAKIALCAPTAAAAKRMKESTGKKAYTIHKLLDIQPTGFGGYTSKNEYNKLEFDFIVVDEASMLDLKIFSMLVASIPNGSSLLLLGDKNQLASVGVGNVLQDMIDANVPQVHLKKIFRQEEASSIVENSFLIKNKNPDLVFDKQTEYYEYEDEESMIEKTRELMQKYYSKTNTNLYTTARSEKFPINTTRLNKLLQEDFNPNQDFLLHGTRKFSVGDPIVFTRNNYQTGYLNGDTGTIVAIEKTTGLHKRLIIDADDETILVSGEDLKDVSLAYATTVHKAQGSECNVAIILLANEPKSLLRNDLFYVASTRAKKKNILIVQNNGTNAMEKAITTTWVLNRKSGLSTRIGMNKENKEEKNDGIK